MWLEPCDLAWSNHTDDGHGGSDGTTCETDAQFDTAIAGIQGSDLSAEVLMDLPPIVSAGSGSTAGSGDNQCNATNTDPGVGVNVPAYFNQAWYGDDASNADILAWDKWIVLHATDDGVELFELGNEPDNYCAMTMNTISAGSCDASSGAREGEYDPATNSDYYCMWQFVVPQLRSYARDLDSEFFIGGPGWAGSTIDGGGIQPDDVQIERFVDDFKADYVSHSDDADYLPDFISSHSYLMDSTTNYGHVTGNTCDGSGGYSGGPGSTESCLTAAETQATELIGQFSTYFANVQSKIDSDFPTSSGYTVDGTEIQDMIKLADTEYNDTIDPGYTDLNANSTWTDWYYDAMFNMFSDAGLWNTSQFSGSSNNGALDLVTTGDATPTAAYYSLQDQT